MTDHSAEQSGEHPGMNTLLLVPDGVSLRNFILTDLPQVLARRGSVDVLFGRGLAQHPAVAEAPIRTAMELLSYPERIAEAPLRRTLEYSHLRWCNTEGTRFVLDEPIPGRTRSQALRWLARSASSLTSSQRGVLGLVSLHERSAARRPEVDTYVGLLEGWQPDVVLCAHQRPLEVLPVVMAARRLGIPTATFIFSWDNLTTKGRIAAPFDYFMVWSDRMRQELLHFYPDVDASRVFVVGSPQFELYADVELTWTRSASSPSSILIRTADSSATRVATPERVPTTPTTSICCAASSTMAASRAILRSCCGRRQSTHPIATTKSSRRRKVTIAKPAWTRNADGWERDGLTRGDLQVLSALTQHSDVNVNMASTMTLDFALHDTPVVNLGFDMRPDRQLAPRYYRLDHYLPVLTFGAARVARHCRRAS